MGLPCNAFYFSMVAVSCIACVLNASVVVPCITRLFITRDSDDSVYFNIVDNDSVHPRCSFAPRILVLPDALLVFIRDGNLHHHASVSGECDFCMRGSALCLGSVSFEVCYVVVWLVIISC